MVAGGHGPPKFWKFFIVGIMIVFIIDIKYFDFFYYRY